MKFYQTFITKYYLYWVQKVIFKSRYIKWLFNTDPGVAKHFCLPKEVRFVHSGSGYRTGNICNNING